MQRAPCARTASSCDAPPLRASPLAVSSLGCVRRWSVHHGHTANLISHWWLSAVLLVQEKEIEVSTLVSTASANPTVVRRPETKAHGRMSNQYRMHHSGSCCACALAAPRDPLSAHPVHRTGRHPSHPTHVCSRVPPATLRALPTTPHEPCSAATLRRPSCLPSVLASQHACRCQSSSGLRLQCLRGCGPAARGEVLVPSRSWEDVTLTRPASPCADKFPDPCVEAWPPFTRIPGVPDRPSPEARRRQFSLQRNITSTHCVFMLSAFAAASGPASGAPEVHNMSA